MPQTIVDCHFHLYDKKINHHPFLEKYDPNLANLWGESYDQRLPNAYSPQNYFADTKKLNVTNLVMAELVSTDPIKEMQYAQELAKHNVTLSAAIASIDLLDKNLPDVLAEYANLPIVRSVRDHLLWNPKNPQQCYARRANILSEPIVSASFAALQQYPFTFEFEIYAHEIPHVLRYAKQFPGINFALHCIGWPLDQTPKGFQQWKQDMQALSVCPNVFVKITAIECIFGINWSTEQISPWIKTTIDVFGAERCMFGSHLPITKLSRGVFALYEAYQAIVSDLTEQEQQYLFAFTAKRFYGI
jgi:predicted TIM-barrel fold metal-dependent hydrolase